MERTIVDSMNMVRRSVYKVGICLLWLFLLLSYVRKNVSACEVHYNHFNPSIVRNVGGKAYRINTESRFLYDFKVLSAESCASNHVVALTADDSVVVPYFSDDVVSSNIKELSRLIAIVIDDFGYRNDWVFDGFLDLDADLTYAVIPGNLFSSSSASMIYDNGYELVVHMPMEAIGYAPGEVNFRLLTSMSESIILSKVLSAIDAVPNAVGMNNHQGSLFTADEFGMKRVGSVLKDVGMYYLDSLTSPESVGYGVMSTIGVPVVTRDVFLDSKDDVNYIVDQIYRLAYVSDNKGYAIGIGHIRLNTLLALQESISDLQEKGYEFVFVSEIVSSSSK
tara:strand:+ start:929 stop:1936 length:1008 start_codon:yes stop_codon:yes gene_type:complete